MRLTLLILLAVGISAWCFVSRSPKGRIDWALAQSSGELVDAYGKPIKRDHFPSKTYTFIYFSAGWCGPCHAFTPDLVQFYKSAGPARNFNIVMVSLDHDQDGLTAYAEEFNMPWVFARMGSKLVHRLRQYASTGIPDLVLINASGAVLADSFSGSDYLGPRHVLEEYGKL